MMDIDEFEDYLELQGPKVRSHIRKSNEEYLVGRAGQLRSFFVNSVRSRGKESQTPAMSKDMTPSFAVRTTRHFDRLLRSLA
jgi:hypothetical protein